MFDKIAALAHDADEMFQQAARQLVETGQLDRLFDLRLMQRRHELGLPLGTDALKETTWATASVYESWRLPNIPGSG